MPTLPLTSAMTEVAGLARPFSGRIVYRQVVGERGALLWQPTERPWRWNAGFAALYTSLALHVALAERLNIALAFPVRLVVGLAEATIARVLDLTVPGTLARLGVVRDDLTTDDYSVTQHLAAASFADGVTALLVPAATAGAAGLYPRFRLVRGKQAIVYPTPASGVNLVIFPDNLRHPDRYPEVDRFACEVTGLTA